MAFLHNMDACRSFKQSYYYILCSMYITQQKYIILYMLYKEMFYHWSFYCWNYGNVQNFKLNKMYYALNECARLMPSLANSLCYIVLQLMGHAFTVSQQSSLLQGNNDKSDFSRIIMYTSSRPPVRQATPTVWLRYWKWITYRNVYISTMPWLWLDCYIHGWYVLGHHFKVSCRYLCMHMVCSSCIFVF